MGLSELGLSCPSMGKVRQVRLGRTSRNGGGAMVMGTLSGEGYARINGLHARRGQRLRGSQTLDQEAVTVTCAGKRGLKSDLSGPQTRGQMCRLLKR